MSKFDDLSKHVDYVNKLNLAGLSGIGEAILQQEKMLRRIAAIPVPDQGVLDAISRAQAVVPNPAVLDAISRSQRQLAAMPDWSKVLERMARAQTAVTTSQPFLDFYDSQKERLAEIALAQMSAIEDQEGDGKIWGGVAALEADLEKLAGDEPTGRLLLIHRLILWSIAVALFTALVHDGYVKGGTGEALLWAATIGVWLKEAYSYLADPQP